MTMPKLIPEQGEVLEMLKKTGAYREGHFVYPSGRHTPHYFQMPLAFRYYDTARVLAVALSRKFRLEKEISSMLPKIAVIAPGAGGQCGRAAGRGDRSGALVRARRAARRTPTRAAAPRRPHAPE